MSAIRSILIVEDVPEMRELLRVLVDGLSGCRVETVVGSAARARVELLRRKPGLVLLDEILPGESSVEFLQELHREGIPVMLLTGMENPLHAVPSEALGRLRKPSSRASLGDFEVWKQQFESLMLRVCGVSS